METLTALLRCFAKQTHAQWWVGQRPEVRDGELPRAIAARVGLPTASIDPFAPDSLVRLERAQAAHVLAVAGTTSLAYGNATPPAGALADAKAALAELGGAATFWSNGRWAGGEVMEWRPLTAATFDCGLIGCDDANAFVFWVEDED